MPGSFRQEKPGRLIERGKVSVAHSVDSQKRAGSDVASAAQAGAGCNQKVVLCDVPWQDYVLERQ